MSLLLPHIREYVWHYIIIVVDDYDNDDDDGGDREVHDDHDAAEAAVLSAAVGNCPLLNTPQHTYDVRNMQSIELYRELRAATQSIAAPMRKH